MHGNMETDFISWHMIFMEIQKMWWVIAHFNQQPTESGLDLEQWFTFQRPLKEF